MPNLLINLDNSYHELTTLCLYTKEHFISKETLSNLIFQKIGLPPNEQFIYSAGKQFLGGPLFDSFHPFKLLLKGLMGGKGGFGSLLKAGGRRMGTQKTTDFGACRDLNGNRIRDVEREKQIKDWEKKRQEEKAVLENKKLQETGKSESLFQGRAFNETNYRNSLLKNAEGVHKSLQEGLKRGETPTTTTKRKKILPFDNELLLLSDNDDPDTVTPKEKKQKIHEFQNESNQKELKTIAEKNSEPHDSHLKGFEKEEVFDDYNHKNHISTEIAHEAKDEIDLLNINSIEELETFGMDILKADLQKYGLKCGGSLHQRAERLYLLKHHSVVDLKKDHPKLFRK